jgi:hypothetical protein
MKTVTAISIALISAMTSVAAAEDAPADDAKAEPSDAAADGAKAEPDDKAATADAAAPASRWPRAVIDRVLTFPKGLAEAGLDIGTPTKNIFNPAAIRVLGGYGITDDLELNFAAYSFTTKSGKGSLDAGVGYKLLRGAAGGKLEVIARLQTGYSIAGKALNPLGLGVQVQYNVTPKIALISPGGQLSIALAGDKKPISLGLPFSVGFQATPELYLQLDTTLATIKIANSANAFLFKDSIPLTIGATYNAMPALDVFAAFSLNAKPVSPLKIGDTLGLLFGARYYIGNL